MDNLFRGIGVSFRDCKRLTIPMGYALRRSRLLVWSGQLCRGMSGNFAWNRRQLCGGISGSFYAESVATFGWNRWQLSRGIRRRRHRLARQLPWLELEVLLHGLMQRRLQTGHLRAGVGRLDAHDQGVLRVL